MSYPQLLTPEEMLTSAMARLGINDVVVLCGSMRFADQMVEVAAEESVAGALVLKPDCNMKLSHRLWEDSAEAEALKTRLDDQHRQKIRLAHRVIVVGDYVGDSTRGEIACARELGKPIRFTHPEVDPANEESADASATDLTEAPEDTIRRFARRLHAVERLCGGRPGYHTITVKALLTAMGEADQEDIPAARCTCTDAGAAFAPAGHYADCPDASTPAETDEERADRLETERDHTAGDHTHCGITCETELPTEHLRNFVVAKGYPGTAGALDELVRRARQEGTRAPADQPGLRDRIAHALAADDGHPWDTLVVDTQQSYLDNADAVLAVLPAQQMTRTPHPAPGKVDTAAAYLDHVLAFLARGGTLSSPEATIEEALRLHTAEMVVLADCAECGHAQDEHEDGDDPVSPGICAACDEDEEAHDFQAPTTGGTS